MSGHAALYTPLPGLPSPESLRDLAPRATVSASASTRTVEWPGVKLVLAPVPAGKLAPRLQGLQVHVQQTCQSHEPTLLARIADMKQGLTVLAEPDFDEGGEARGFLFALAAHLRGLCFLAGAVYSPEGVCVAAPPEVTAGSPTAARVARRALVLGAVAARVSLEGDTGGDREERRQWLLGRMRELELTREWEPEEQRLLETPAGQLSREQTIESSWRSEGLVVLAWALGQSEVPPHDSLAETWDLLIHGLKLLTAARPSVLVAPRLRPLEELQEMRRRLEAVHTRLREFLLHPQAVDGDLSVDGVPLVQAPQERVWECQSIALERQQAIHWLLGSEPVYSRVDAPAP